MPSPSTSPPTPGTRGPYKPIMIIHGGAGNISRDNLPPLLYVQYESSLLSILSSTNVLLVAGLCSAVDAACQAVSAMEDDPLFNCGRGSVFTSAGEIEMEASLAVTCIDQDDDGVQFEGMVKRSAAVSMIRRTRHPILLAREVLKMGDEDGGMGGTGEMHGHLSGANVENWGWSKGLEKKPKEWFWTKRRWEEHRRELKQQGEHLKPLDDPELLQVNEASQEDVLPDEPAYLADILELPSQGTVGAVCMDEWGVIAVATSTGGLTNKQPGRIGDTPTVGAGFWAETWNETSTLSQEEQEAPKAASLSEKLAAAAKSELKFWVGDCVRPSPRQPSYEETSGAQSSAYYTSEKHNLVYEPPQATRPAIRSVARRAVAMSGTGNGDSFLRVNACRTAAAMARFSSPTTRVSLFDAVHSVAGSGGELQRSAKERWGKTGEGEGGIIGVELARGEDGKATGTAVFDFNCGGLWRAYFEENSDGEQMPRIMVFRNEY